ncbi:MAG: dihydrolipoamide acetyltransferase component of pyruvate dehydrogenase complex [Chloroflexota bacterium]|nr:MAG: dihydrolipoamide acetyltransferase component of pyruvate dehydrogenase complex [Chloroflexota bacterium]
MATAVVMPKQGQSVESCLIVGWKKDVGDQVTAGEILAEVETDKALVEVESPAAGTVLALFFEAGDDVPVLTNIAAIGQPGEDISSLRPAGAKDKDSAAEPVQTAVEVGNQAKVPETALTKAVETAANAAVGISPRARNLAKQKGLALVSLAGSGPAGRIIERDVQAALAQKPVMTPLAKSMAAQGGFQVPDHGSGVRGRIMADDLQAVAAQPDVPAPVVTPAAVEDEMRAIPVKGIRKVIATRMLNSLQTTAQLTLNASADAAALLAYRKRLKESAETLGLRQVTINDLLLLAVSRTLPQFPELNATFSDDVISQYKNVHLGLAVDTPRGLMVPVIRRANTLSLKEIAQEAKRLAAACLDSTISADEMNGGTFTVTNLGSFGIESFTPVLNAPQVGILGVGNINLKPVERDSEVQFIPHLGLSLTINHQVVDGAPAARFLQALAQGLAQIELLLAL